jgi:hypothetical protein
VSCRLNLISRFLLLLNDVILIMCHLKEERVRAMMFSATFNNISAILWQSVLLAEETKVHGENQRPDASN